MEDVEERNHKGRFTQTAETKAHLYIVEFSFNDRNLTNEIYKRFFEKRTQLHRGRGLALAVGEPIAVRVRVTQCDGPHGVRGGEGEAERVAWPVATWTVVADPRQRRAFVVGLAQLRPWASQLGPFIYCRIIFF